MHLYIYVYKFYWYLIFTTVSILPYQIKDYSYAYKDIYKAVVDSVIDIKIYFTDMYLSIVLVISGPQIAYFPLNDLQYQF